MVAKTEHRMRSSCPIACSLDILGDHWNLLIIRSLMFAGLHEYKDMLKMPEQISSSILSDRLKKLEAYGIISSIPHPDSGKRKLYYLLPMGKDLIHVMLQLVLWGEAHLGEWVNFPPEILKLIKESPDAFKSHTLKQLQDWEDEYLK